MLLFLLPAHLENLGHFRLCTIFLYISKTNEKLHLSGARKRICIQFVFFVVKIYVVKDNWTFTTLVDFHICAKGRMEVNMKIWKFSNYAFSRTDNPILSKELKLQNPKIEIGYESQSFLNYISACWIQNPNGRSQESLKISLGITLYQQTADQTWGNPLNLPKK